MVNRRAEKTFCEHLHRYVSFALSLRPHFHPPPELLANPFVFPQASFPATSARDTPNSALPKSIKMPKTAGMEHPRTAAPPHLILILASHTLEEHGRCRLMKTLRPAAAERGFRRLFACNSKLPGRIRARELGVGCEHALPRRSRSARTRRTR